MNFSKGKIKDFYLLTTDVENIFINEYMPGAPGDYVKVYLYGLLYGQLGNEMTHEALARQLRLSEDTVNKAWNYWSDMGVVKKLNGCAGGILNYDIEFVNLRALMYGTFDVIPKENENADKPEDGFNKMVQADIFKTLISEVEQTVGKILSSKEIREVSSWVNELNVQPAIICKAFDYCYGKGKTNVNYIAKVVLEWTSLGISDEKTLEEHLKSIDERQAKYKRVLQCLGMNRGATEAEKQLMDTWFDRMGYNLERVLEACGRTVSISNPSLRYVNKVLENWSKEANEAGRDVNSKVTVTQAVLNKYYEYLREKAKDEAQERRNQIYSLIPRIKEIDETITNLGTKISKALLTGSSKDDINETRRLMGLLEEERAVLLTENNFNIDYTDTKYSCEKCNDTGIDENGQRCSCTKERMGEAELWQKTIS